MTEKRFREEILERLENIERKVNALTTILDDLFQTLDQPNIFKPAQERRERLNDYERSINPWTERSIRGISNTDIDPKILGKTETILPTLKALGSNPKGLTAKEVSGITERDRTTEANYLRKMYILGIVDKEKSGRKIIYKLSASNIPEHIKNRI
ncbi:MAG: hypothetical protein PVF58_03940 [Candidatus Methanofastidiosia archaeon]